MFAVQIVQLLGVGVCVVELGSCGLDALQTAPLYALQGVPAEMKQGWITLGVKIRGVLGVAAQHETQQAPPLGGGGKRRFKSLQVGGHDVDEQTFVANHAPN